VGDARVDGIEEFARELRRVRTDAGQPSLPDLESVSRRPGGVPVSGTAMSAVLAGGQVPTWEFVVGFVTACEAYATGHGISLPADVSDLDRLRRRYDGVLAELDRTPQATVRTAAAPESADPASLPDGPRPQPLIASDFWTIKDELSHAYYADAIADFVRHPHTLPPLTIGLKAPWGAGKTSLMRMIQNNLNPRPGNRPSRLQLDVHALGVDTRAGRLLARRRRRQGRTAGITNLDILREANAAEDTTATGRQGTGAPEAAPGPLRAELADGAPADASAWRPTVWFNPWMYQNGEQTWAGLAYEIISQVTERLRPVDRELFWLLLNLSRVDPSVVRRRWYRLLVERLVPLILVWATTIAVALIALLIAELIPAVRDELRYLSSGLSGAGTVVLLVGGLANVWTFVNRRAVGPLTSLVRKPDVGAADRAFLDGQFSGSFDQLVPDPGYTARLGFLYLVQTDMHRVLRLIATPERPLVIFVDDLDRCSPGTVSHVIEAINLFLAGEFPNCVFVLGLEPSAVALHIETAYPDLVQAQRDGHPDGEWSTLGWRFLDKIIQLPLSVPSLRTDDDVARYLRSLMRSDLSAPALAAPTRPATVPVPGSQDSVSPPHGPAAPAVEVGNPDDASGPAKVEVIEKAIRARHPSPENIRDVALEVQQEVLGKPAPILPVTLSAASRTIATLYSDAEAYDTLRDALPLLPSRNPREIKRFVNLFRFYSFIAQRSHLIGGLGASREQIAKVAAFAIRWPSVVSMLAAVPDTNGYILQALENAARADDPALWDKAVRENLPRLIPPYAQAAPHVDPPTPTDPPGAQNRELRQFMREGVDIGTIAVQFF
jgi:KAP family P-loop domain